MTPASFIFAENPQTPPFGLEGGVYAIGNFDGLHRGHAAVIERARRMAARLGAPCGLLTFEPHPADFFAGAPVVFRLTDVKDKAEICRALGLDGLVAFSFDAAFAALTAEGFVDEILIKRLAIRGVVAGYDFHFGAGRAGAPAFLKDAGARRGFEVEIASRVVQDNAGEAVSSSATRAALERGDVAAAALLLGRFWSIRGIVIAGQKLGRQLGFPTANIAMPAACRLRWGVYAVRARIDGEIYGGAASLGVRPSVDNGPLLLEINIFDFSGDLYGQEIVVEFVAFLRPEEKFETLEALKRQIAADVEKTHQILSQLS